MATLLYRLGRWCADHVRTLIAAWLVALVALGSAAVSFGTDPSPEVTLPDTNFQRVLDDLGAQIPEAAGGFGTVIIHSSTGPFTDAQKSAITAVFDAWSALDKVERVMDPFTAQAQIDATPGKLAAAKAQLDGSAAQIADGQAQLDAAKGQLDFGKRYLAQLESSNPQDPTLPGLRAQVADGEAQYAAGLAEFEAGKAQFEAGLTQWERRPPRRWTACGWSARTAPPPWSRSSSTAMSTPSSSPSVTRSRSWVRRSPARA